MFQVLIGASAASRLILITGDILINTPLARPLHSPPKRNRNISSRARNTTEKRADTASRRRRPMTRQRAWLAANSRREPGRARARGRALVSLGLFIYCCAKHRARRVCDARIVISEHGVRRGLSVDRE